MIQAMSPVYYRDDPAGFSRRQADLNEVLVFAGYRINDEGKVVRSRGGKASTLDEAAERANTIRAELLRRETHPDVLRYCTSELLNKDTGQAFRRPRRLVNVGFIRLIRDPPLAKQCVPFVWLPSGHAIGCAVYMRWPMGLPLRNLW